MKRLMVLLACTATLAALLLPATASAAFTTNTECLACHDSATGVGAVSKVDFSAGGSVDYSKCKACHWIDQTRKSHSTFNHAHVQGTISRLGERSGGYECPSCHGGILTNNGDLTRLMTTNTAYGWFATADPTAIPAAQLHAIHANGSWPKTALKLASSCQSCHEAPTCTACHVAPPTAHADHTYDSLTGALAYPAVSYRVGAGTPTATPDINSVTTVSLTCVNPACHAPAVAGTAAFTPFCGSCHPAKTVPHGYESVNHVTSIGADLESGSTTPCGACHATDLMTEHAKPTSLGARDCTTCHPSPRNTFGAWNQGCDQCHGLLAPDSKHGGEAAKHAGATSAECVTCHDTSLDAIHSTATTTTPSGTFTACLVCHNDATSLPGKTCVTCHFTFDGHYDVTKHTSSWTLGASCGGADCHVSADADLMRVHNTFRTFTCAECHSSARTAVTDAIATHLTACDACHAGASQTDSHRAIHLAKPPLMSGTAPPVAHYSYWTGSKGTAPTSDCIGCHTSNLVDEHMGVRDGSNWSRLPRTTSAGAALTCASCHASTDPAISQAITLGDSACDACHAVHGPIPQIHTSSFADTQVVPCAGCHDSNLATVHNGTMAATTPSGATLTGCAICHDYFEAPRGTTVQAAIDGNDARCTACHAATHEDLGGHTASASAKCAGCHVVGDIRPLHATRNEGPCAVCHDNPTRVGAIKTKTAECVSCHSAIDSSLSAHTRYSAKHVSAQTDCAGSGCHALGDLAALHASAVDGALTGCAVCHRSPTDQPTSSDCRSCHVNEGTDYHARTAMLHYSPTLTDCFQSGCHDVSKSLPAVHEPFVGPGKEYATTCDLCHRNTTPGRIDWTRATARCTGVCHDVATHSGMQHVTPAPASQECLGCHVAAGVAEIHGAEFFNNAKHEKCATCHDSPDGGDLTWNKTTSDCAGCHDYAPAATNHYKAPGHLAAEGPDCSDCHLMPLVAEHDRATGSTLTCLGCHTSARFTGLARPWDKTCTSCHAVKHGDTAVKHASTTAACSGGGCHAIGDLATLHSKATTTVAGVAYSACRVCHRSPTDQPTSSDCRSCHDDHGDLNVAHTSTASPECLTCHTPADVRTLHAKRGCAICHDNPARVPTLPATVECSNCHPGHGDLTAKHTAAASASCVACHETGDVRGLHKTKGCASCHGNPAVPTLPANVECASCHGTLVPIDPNHYAAADHTASETGCTNCHYLEMKPEHSKASVSPAVTCVSCHETKVDAFTGAWNKTCAACHAVRHAAQAAKHVSSNASCSGTGCHNIADVSDLHKGVQGGGCAVCHASRDSVPVGKTDCASAGCHAGIGTNHHALHDASASIDAGCKGCHYAYLDDEHAALGLTCATCHSSTNTAVVAAIRDSRRDCAACHPAVNGKNRHLAQNTLEFNKGNSGGHRAYSSLPFMKTSFTINGATYTWSAPAATSFLKTGWTTTSVVTCDKCHSFATTAAGPHGSAVKVNMDPAYPTDWKTVYLNNGGASSSTFICAKCHTNFGRMNDVHGESDHEGSSDGKCIGCHTKVPHGWRLPRLLAYRDDPAPYNSLYLTGLRVKSYSPSNWSESDCSQSGCDEHSSSMSNRWPSAVTTTGALKGRVVDTSGGAVSAASVTTDKGQSTTTDANGYYDFGSIGVATYNITAAKTGFTSQMKPGAVIADQTTTVDFALVPVPVNLALGKTFAASRTYSSSYAANYAGDGNTSTYWRSGSLSSSTQIEWLRVDLAAAKSISKAEVVWASSRHATEFRVYVSNDNVTWTQVYATTSGTGGTSTATFAATARYVKVECRRASSSSNGYGIAELRVFN